MRRSVVVVALLMLFACSGETQKPLSEPGEKLYTVRGTILSRNSGANTLDVDHEEIPGFMAAMRMDYSVRGAKVGDLPPDKSRIEARLHVTERAFWLTDVKKLP